MCVINVSQCRIACLYKFMLIHNRTWNVHVRGRKMSRRKIETTRCNREVNKRIKCMRAFLCRLYCQSYRQDVLERMQKAKDATCQICAVIDSGSYPACSLEIYNASREFRMSSESRFTFVKQGTMYCVSLFWFHLFLHVDGCLWDPVGDLI